ncbi:MAG: hypothetical protein IJU71_07190, partial [Selenomonadaceae bacterium]|nr:hypothetical protein [Selenomonadaceae bacterium]
HNMGLDELCAFSEQEYIDKAVELANDYNRITEYHLTIRRRMSQSPVMNDSIYMSELEAAYEKIYNAWINSKPLPDFPDDEPSITAEVAAQYYQRALEYIKAEPNFYEGTIKNVVNIKRADYWLEQAAKADAYDRAEIHLLLSYTKLRLSNPVAAYEKVQVVEECLPKPKSDVPPIVAQSLVLVDKQRKYSREFLQRYHKHRARLAMINSNPNDGVKHFNIAVNLTDDPTEQAAIFGAALHNLHYLNLPSEDLIVNHFRYQNIFDKVKRFDRFGGLEKSKRGERRIRIGYLLPKFGLNNMFSLSCAPLICANKQNFECFAYKTIAGDPFYSNLLKKSPLEHFVEVVGMTPEQIAQRIHDDQIDILVDLGGHSELSNLPIMAYKPAPIQMTGSGALSTSGLKTVDYFLTDEIADPPGLHNKFFAEKLLYLPSQFSYIARNDVAEPSDAPMVKTKFVTFGSFNDYQSLTNEILGVWCEILKRVPNARLIMRAKEFNSDAVIDAAYKRLKALGFNMNAILFIGTAFDHMKDFQRIDIALSTYPQTDPAMTIDALYMGVPVISIYTGRRDTRLAFDLLSHVGLPELACENAQDYLVRAVGLATNLDTLNTLHKNLRAMIRRAQTINPSNYVANLEQQYRRLIDDYRIEAI